MKTSKSRLVVSALCFAAIFSVAGPVIAEGPIDLNGLLAKGGPVLLEFGRGWCKPCKYMKPILEDLAKAYKGKAIVTTADIDANPQLVRAFRIRMMPTQVFVSPDGKEFFRNEGIMERDRIIEVFSKMGVPPPAQTGAAVAPNSNQARQKPW